MTENEMGKVGITTTVPLEPFIAAEKIPVDLNNLFINSRDPNSMVEESQVRGYPRNICTWIKGLHTAADGMDAVVGVVRGDCSNTESLLETLSREGKPVHPFSYPFDRDRDELVSEIEALCEFLGTDIDGAGDEAGYVRGIRDLALKLDEICWKEGILDSDDVHTALVSVSDLSGNPEEYRRKLHDLIDGSRERISATGGPRLAFIGVPPIIKDLFKYLESMRTHVVFFETQRQFAMPARTGDWIQDYLEYTYPYDISSRVEDIRIELKRRDVDGVIHYVQSFCHRQIDDVIFRKELDVPLMTLEGNLPGPLDGRNRIRIEAFLDILEVE